MGAVTGKGLSDLIREEFGFRVTFIVMLALFVTNFFNIVAEFAGVASSLELFGVSRYIVVPAGCVRSSGRWSSMAPTAPSRRSSCRHRPFTSPTS